MRTEPESNETPQETHEPKWIIDQEAWIETVNEPIYEYQEKSICNACGGEITGFENTHIKEHMMNGENGSWRSEFSEVQTGVNSYEIMHDEVGHWE